MAESPELHQIEYRWQPAKDMSAVASSMSPESFRSWVQRIGPWVRHPGVDAPTDSVRYEIFGDRAAALAWRQRDRQAVEFEDGQDGRPLASRVLLGPADLLTPEVAIAVCYAGLPRTIGPRPGTVTAGTALPPVAAARLTGLVQDNAEALDLAAAQEAGLEQVVAAALSDRDTPLSVQLPERIIVRSPRGNSQALLLWGLRRTVGPVLGRADGRRGLVVLDLRTAVERHGPGNAAGDRVPLGPGGAAGGAHDNPQGDPGPAAGPDPCIRRDRTISTWPGCWSPPTGIMAVTSSTG